MTDSPTSPDAAMSAPGPGSDGEEGLASRWCDAAKERAYAIVNDIAEDIDNGESREELRQALAIYADLLWDAHQTRRDKLMDETLAALQRLETAVAKSQNTEAE